MPMTPPAATVPGYGQPTAPPTAAIPGYGQPATPPVVSGTYPPTGTAYPGYPANTGWAQPGLPTAPPTQPGGYYGQPGLPTTGGYPQGAAYPGYTAGTTAQPAAPAAMTPLPPRTLLEIGNSQPVLTQPTKASKLDLSDPHVITLIRTFHWNGGRGAPPGSITLRCRDGRNYGPWQAMGEPGPNGIPNASWVVYPNTPVPSCVCTVEVSDPYSWSQNGDSSGRGFVKVEGYPTGSAAGQQVRTGNESTDTALEGLGRAHDALRKMDETKRALERIKDLFK
jgi:hypothetical protein